MKPIVDYRESLFEKVYPVKEPVAKKMLQIGYKHPSRFGSWCPVKVGYQDVRCPRAKYEVYSRLQR